MVRRKIARLRDSEIARLRGEDSSDESDRLDGRPADQIARLRSCEGEGEQDGQRKNTERIAIWRLII